MISARTSVCQDHQEQQLQHQVMVFAKAGTVAIAIVLVILCVIVLAMSKTAVLSVVHQKTMAMAVDEEQDFPQIGLIHEDLRFPFLTCMSI